MKAIEKIYRVYMATSKHEGGVLLGRILVSYANPEMSTKTDLFYLDNVGLSFCTIF